MRIKQLSSTQSGSTGSAECRGPAGTRRSFSQRYWVAGALSAIVLVATACGGGSSESATAGAQATQAATGGTIQLSSPDCSEVLVTGQTIADDVEACVFGGNATTTIMRLRSNCANGDTLTMVIANGEEGDGLAYLESNKVLHPFASSPDDAANFESLKEAACAEWAN